MPRSPRESNEHVIFHYCVPADAKRRQWFPTKEAAEAFAASHKRDGYVVVSSRSVVAKDIQAAADKLRAAK